MAKLKAAPKNFAEALEFLHVSGGLHCVVRLGNNTYLECFTDGTQIDLIAVRLHETQVVKFYPDGRVTLHTDGHRTVTTKERINHFITGKVWQKNHVWFYTSPCHGWTVEFEEGMAV